MRMSAQELREVRQERSTYEKKGKAVVCGFCDKLVVSIWESDAKVVGKIGAHTAVERDGKIVGVCWGVLRDANAGVSPSNLKGD